ncbi:MAG: alpha/beta hydrolase [Clostridia bacterium]|nr:alpha/beta hydrolase [Clostridia bacterium]
MLSAQIGAQHLLSVLSVLIIITSACVIYLFDYYHADPDAVGAYAELDGNIVFEAENSEVGFIFYPGGKVEYTAYAPLMSALAERGITCVLVEMPFNLAVFDIDAAEGIQADYPHIKDWYIGGHSLGGSMAASYLADNAEDYRGLVLLGSYSTADLNETVLKVLSVYGSEDKVLNLDKYNQYKPNLPDDFTELVIEGGCHAYFGAYGEQKGDGKAAITREEQTEQTVSAILDMINDEN